MKTCNTFLLAALVTLGSFVSGTAQEITSLHEDADVFIKTHFQGQAVTEMDIDANDHDMYDVKLADGTELEFDRNGEILKMENHNGLPLTALPKGMGAYINASYTGEKAVEFEKETNGYEIELANNTELEFDTNGKFLKIDK